MKKAFQSFALYNRSVNLSVLELVEPLPKDKIMFETKAFYPTIFATLLHIFVADILWLRRYRDFLKENKILKDCKFLQTDEKMMQEELKADYKKYFEYRKELDEAIVQFVDSLTAGEIDSVIKYKDYMGRDIEKELWKTLLHWFNHQTHHRGQVSVLLDLIGVNHDYSGLVNRV
jgi:uncharacterized damage-inducible protein DinB